MKKKKKMESWYFIKNYNSYVRLETYYVCYIYYKNLFDIWFCNITFLNSICSFYRAMTNEWILCAR